MGRKNVEELKFRRRREAKTNYAKRLALVKGNLDRIVVRRSNKRIVGQVIRYNEKGDVVLYGADSRELRALGWPARSNRSSAYLTGMLLGSKIRPEDRQKEYILDIGLNSPVKNSIPFVFAKGCKESGIKLRGVFEVEPKFYDSSLVSIYAKGLKEKDEKAYQRQFSTYAKEKVTVESMSKLFIEAKEKIKGGAINK
ncbi:MAG: 50S ribosomal protein L18 [Candidatus Micrarchaeota archaeon]|nr:50S ribosomal protein L18 [Candidatus Micrarchaeota archaeon]MDE1864560.1 50S ribosomal protein L18 [Candidatus Micrarchaeota archaeon]